MKKKNPYKDPWTQTFPQDIADDWKPYVTSCSTGSSLTLEAMESAFSALSNESGWVDISKEEEDTGVQLWDKLQELLPGAKTECPIRKKIKMQALDPYDFYRDPSESFKEKYNF